jgi:phosphonate transport system substrate-binding protein
MTHQLIRFATFLAPNMFPVYQSIADYVGEKLDCPTELIIGSDFGQFAAGEADIGFICGLPYVQLARQSPAPVELLAAPVLQGERYGGRPIYFSDVIVRRDSPFQNFADLRGCCWSYNDLGSHSGYNITRYHLVQLGQTEGYFGRVVAAGSHQNSIRLICAGEVEASAIDSQVLAIELRDQPELGAQLRLIDALGPAAIQPVVAARQLPGGLKAEVRAILLEMGADPIAKNRLAHGFVDRFAPVTDSTYDDIREMLAAAEAIGFMEIR